MNIEEAREYCMQKKGATECLPFDDVTLVFKVANKMFGLLNLDGENSMNLKCNPEQAIELREKYTGIIPGYHMNKTHWNTIFLDELATELIKEMITHSYELVVNSLSKKVKNELDQL